MNEYTNNSSLFIKKIYRNTFLIVLSKHKLKNIYIVMINSTNIKEYKAVIVLTYSIMVRVKKERLDNKCLISYL